MKPVRTAFSASKPSDISTGPNRLPDVLEEHAPRLHFYGDIDFIPTEEYTEFDSARAIRDANFVVEMARKVIPDRE